MPNMTPPIIVGIDGSANAADAARWAADVAANNQAPLRLVYVVRTDLSGPLQASQYRTAVEKAKAALQSARDAVEAVHENVVVETDIAEGLPAGVLLAESRDVSMICLGSSGIGRVGQASLGSTAAMVAEKASCSVAIVSNSSHEAPPQSQTQWIVIPVPDTSEFHGGVLGAAAHQATVRGCAILALGVRSRKVDDVAERRLTDWVSVARQRFPNVPIYPVCTRRSLAGFLRKHPEIANIVVIDDSYAGDLRSILSACRSSHTDHAEVVALVARDPD